MNEKTFKHICGAASGTKLASSQAILTHSFSVHPFSIPRKHQKTLRFSDIFGGKRKGALGTNGIIMGDLEEINSKNP